MSNVGTNAFVNNLIAFLEFRYYNRSILLLSNSEEEKICLGFLNPKKKTLVFSKYYTAVLIL